MGSEIGKVGESLNVPVEDELNSLPTLKSEAESAETIKIANDLLRSLESGMGGKIISSEGVGKGKLIKKTISRFEAEIRRLLEPDQRLRERKECFTLEDLQKAPWNFEPFQEKVDSLGSRICIGELHLVGKKK